MSTSVVNNIKMKYSSLLLLVFMMFISFCACAKIDDEIENYDNFPVDSNDVSFLEMQLLREHCKGKKISILGNSRCTFKGYNPSSNRYYYPKGNVDDVSKTWWWMVLDTIGASLDVNNSYSAGRITNTHSTYPNYLSRIDNLGTPDIIFLWGGVNDQNNGIEVGTIDFSLPDEKLDESKFAPALILLIRKLKRLYINSQIIMFVEDDLNGNYNETIHDISTYFGLNTIDFKNHSTSKFDALHYDEKGMTQIANETIKQWVKFIH